MDLKSVKKLDAIYFLDRNCWNVNDPEALIVEMNVIEEDGKWFAFADQGHDTLQVELNEDFIAQMNHSKTKYLFETKQEARAHYEQELQKDIQAIHDTSKHELLQHFFQLWKGSEVRDNLVTNTMKEKIMTEFGIYVM